MRLLSETFRAASGTSTACWCVQIRKTLPWESTSGGRTFPDLQIKTTGNGFRHFLHNFPHEGRPPPAHFGLLSVVKKKHLRSREAALFNCGSENKISVCTVWKATVEVRMDLFCFSTQGLNASAQRTCSASKPFLVLLSLYLFLLNYL